MTPAQVLNEARRRGIELRAVGDKLRFRPVKSVTPELLAALREHKPALLALLQPPAASRYDVPAGWTAESWVKRLRYLAGICIVPARAIELGEWADGLEREAQREGEQCDGASRNG